MKEIVRSVVVNQDKTNQCREAHNEIGMMSVLCKRLNIIKRIVAVLYCVEYVPCTVLRTTLLTPPVHCIMYTSQILWLSRHLYVCTSLQV